MYRTYFNLHRLPFNNTPDPAFYYSTPDHEEALATLQYATQQRKGFVLVTGEVGAGKTLIGRIFLRQIDANASTAVINHTHLTGRQLLATIGREFALEAPPEASNLELTQRLQDYLLEQYARDRYVVVLLDEAQNLPDEALEELRMLGNLEADEAKLLQVCILGQPELRIRFRKSTLRQLDQRLFRRFHLPSLTKPQTGEYIFHRLEVAGGTNDRLFTAEAIDRIYAASQGIPRLINQICDNALLTAYGRQADTVDGKIISLVLDQDAEPPSRPAPERREETPRRKPAPRPPEDSTEQFQTDQRIESIYGQRPILSEAILTEPLIDPVESGHLADLVETQTRELSQQVQTIAAAPKVSQEDIMVIAQRQNELQKIVGGATTRWLAAKERIEAYRNELHTAITCVVARCDSTQEQLEELTERLPTAEEPAEKRSPHEPQIRDVEVRIDNLTGRVKGHENQIRFLLERLDALVSAADNSIKALEDRTVTAQDLESIRGELARNTDDLLRRLDEESAAVNAFKTQIGKQQSRAGEDHQAQIKALADRVAEQLANLNTIRQELLASQTPILEQLLSLGERFAARQEVEHIRQRQQEESARQVEMQEAIQDQHEQAAAIREQLDDHRKAVEGLFENVMERCRYTEEQLDALSAAKVSQEQFTAHSTGQEEDFANLLGQMDGHRREVQEQFERIYNRWQQTQEQIQQMGATLAEAEEVEHIRQQQERDTAGFMEALTRQRGDLESLLEGVSRRCEQTIARLSELPANVASADHLHAIRAEHNRQIREIFAEIAARQADVEQTIRNVEARCEQTQKALEEFTALAATNQDMQLLRQEHAQSVSNLLNHIDRTSSEHQNQVEDLNRRWANLTRSVKKLAAITTPASAFKAAKQSLSESVDNLNKQFENLSGKQEGDLRTLIDKIQQTSDRLGTLENREYRSPIEITMTPQATRELAGMLGLVRKEREQLRDEVERAGAIASHLHNSSAQVREIMQHWVDHSGVVRQEADQLRSSVKAAAGILQAMHKCSTAIDAKLKSPRWQAELKSGENLTTRMEKAVAEAQGVYERLNAALADLESCENQAQTWSRRHEQARQMTGRMETVLTAAEKMSTRMEQYLEDRGRLIKAIAQNTAGLVDVIQSARIEGEQHPPPTPARIDQTPKNPPKRVHSVNWPALK